MAGLALIVWGFADYRATGWINVWYPPKALKHITVALMLPAVILVVASYIRGRIYTTLKHPMLAGVKLWAAAHPSRLARRCKCTARLAPQDDGLPYLAHCSSSP